MNKHFTATTYVIKDNRTLLIYHRKFNKWQPPGGHIHPNETPPEAARREVFEETGLHIEFIDDQCIKIDRPNAQSIERPYLCWLEDMPSFQGQPAHQHIDMIFLATPIGGDELENDAESKGIHWFTLEEINRLQADVDIFGEVQMLLNTLLEPA